ncbi:MAG: type II secretion system F family protein [Eubacterium sp.]
MSKKKKKKDLEPQYYMSATNTPVLNYKVYYMKPLEKILYFLLAFIVGAAVGYLFYGGIGKDEYGNPTTVTFVINITIPTIVGLFVGRKFVPMRQRQIIEKRVRMLRFQFRDMLDSLNTALGAGKNVPDSFLTVYNDLQLQYDSSSFIINELAVIISGMQNNVDIEDMLEDLGTRSGIDDIISFANVFRISYRKGGNIKDVIRNTYNIITEKMEIEDEIDTMLASNKMEQNIMIFMPIVLIALIKMMGADFADNFVTPAGIASTTVAIAIFAAAYWLCKELMDIKI